MKYEKDLSQRQANALAKEYRTDKSMQSDRDLTLALCRKMPAVYEYADENVKADEEIAETCFLKDGRLIRFAPDSVRGNPILAATAVRNFPPCYSFLCGKARENREIALIVAKNGGGAVELLPDRFLDDKEVAMVAVEKNPKNIRLFSERIRADRDVCLAALAGDRTVGAYFSDDAFKDDEVFEKVTRADRGIIEVNSLSNDVPLGLLEKMAEKGMTARFIAQKIDPLTVPYEKLNAVLTVFEGNVVRKKEILQRIIDKDDRPTAELLCSKFQVPPEIIKELLPYAVKNRKMRVIPFLMSYAHGKKTGEKQERDRITRGLKRNSTKAVEILINSIDNYKNDREVIALCAEKDGAILKYIQDSDLFFDPEIVSACVKTYIVKNADEPFVTNFKTLPFSYEDIKILCRRDYRNLFALGGKYLEDPVLCAEAVKSGEKAYEMLPDDMKKDPLVMRSRR